MQPGALSGEDSAWVKITRCGHGFCWLLYAELAQGDSSVVRSLLLLKFCSLVLFLQAV